MSWASRPDCPFYSLYALPDKRKLVGPLGSECAILSTNRRFPGICRMDFAGLRPDWNRCGFDNSEASAALARWLREGWWVIKLEGLWQ